MPPAPGRQQVLVKVKAAGVNFYDLYTCYGINRQGDEALPLGLEATGVVEKVGAEANFKVNIRKMF